jgi:putative glycosyltransferase (TIGR04348 family)
MPTCSPCDLKHPVTALRIALITPALSDANNGNWQTAQRWAVMMASRHTVDLALGVESLPMPVHTYDVLIALHARRSATSVAAFAAACPQKPLWVVLTGTDLYRDIACDEAAQQSIALATVLIVLQEHGVNDLPPELRSKARVVFQSSPLCAPPPPVPCAVASSAAGFAVQARIKTPLNIVVVGHLRREKSPETTLAIARLLAQNALAARIQHIGRLLDDEYSHAVHDAQTDYPAHYQWLGGLAHSESLKHIAQADVLLHPSAMEGGSLTIIEAIQCGKAVIASRVAGHIGLLGMDYLGLFDWGDAVGAVRLLERFASEPSYRTSLYTQCAARRPLFAPEHERQTLLNLLAD